MSQTGFRELALLDGGDLAGAALALRRAGLPSVDLEGEATRFFRLDDAAGPLGWAALERHGPDALLRSVVTLGERRGSGAGTDLVKRLMRLAADEGVERLWLLTESAEPFFARLGFAPAARDEAPEAIRRTSEFSTLCPVSAACMTLTLARP